MLLLCASNLEENQQTDLCPFVSVFWNGFILLVEESSSDILPQVCQQIRSEPSRNVPKTAANLPDVIFDTEWIPSHHCWTDLGIVISETANDA